MTRTIARGAAEYPARLLALRDPPTQLHILGALPDPARPAAALVGSRRATPQGLDVAARMAADLARAGVVVVSGGAFGIDAAAHQGALDAGGTTVVVLPTSLEAPYPRRNRPLFSRVVHAGGACVAEHIGAVPAQPWRFVVRNRLVAALADVVVVVEARARSGTASTAEAARALGRALAAVPWRPDDPAGAGCLAVLRAGGRMVASAGDVLALLPGCPPSVVRAPRSAAGLAAVLAARGPLDAGAMAAMSGRPVADVLVELTALELAGEVVPQAGGLYRARRR